MFRKLGEFIGSAVGVGVLASLGCGVVLVVLAAGPFFSIKALNVLFDTQIPVTWQTWLAMFWLHVLLVARHGHTSAAKRT